MPTLPAARQKQPVDRESLLQAFESFTHVAGSLESSYARLQGELAILRHELEIKNQDLANSLAENKRIKTYLAGLLEDLPCGVLAVDAEFRLRFANPIVHQLLISKSENARDLAAVPESLRLILEEIASEGPGAERLWTLDTPEGKKVFAVIWALRSQTGPAGGERVFILRDATGQMRLEEERDVSRRMKALAEMTALLAHEIRNPLGSLELFAGLIKEAAADPEIGQWAVHMQAGLRALSATVNNVLHFHSMGPAQLAPVNAVRLLADTVEFLQPLALQRGMGIEFTPRRIEVLISASAHHLQQVFFNLAINAFRAMPAGKRLKISVGVEDESSNSLEGVGRCARIDFEDEGAGIDPARISRIFEAGFSTASGSPGLGLAVAKRIVANHGGTIAVASEPGKGAAFTLRLPLLRVNA